MPALAVLHVPEAGQAGQHRQLGNAGIAVEAFGEPRCTASNCLSGKSVDAPIAMEAARAGLDNGMRFERTSHHRLQGCTIEIEHQRSHSGDIVGTEQQAGRLVELHIDTGTSAILALEQLPQPVILDHATVDGGQTFDLGPHLYSRRR